MKKNSIVKNIMNVFNSKYKNACIKACKNYNNYSVISQLYDELYEIYDILTDVLISFSGLSVNEFKIICKYMMYKIDVFFNCYMLKH